MDSGVIVSGPAPLLTLREAAAFLRCSPSTLYSTAWRRAIASRPPSRSVGSPGGGSRISRRAAESGAQRERQEPRSSHARFARNQAGRDSRPNQARSTQRATWCSCTRTACTVTNSSAPGSSTEALASRGHAMNPTLAFNLSSVYRVRSLAQVHRDDLNKSSISELLRVEQGIRSVPPSDFDGLLGRNVSAAVHSLLLLPYPDPAGGWMDHFQVKVFPPPPDTTDRRPKYLQPKGAGSHVYFVRRVLADVLTPTRDLWICEGARKRFGQRSWTSPSSGFRAWITGTRAGRDACSVTSTRCRSRGRPCGSFPIATCARTSASNGPLPTSPPRSRHGARWCGSCSCRWAPSSTRWWPRDPRRGQCHRRDGRSAPGRGCLAAPGDGRVLWAGGATRRSGGPIQRGRSRCHARVGSRGLRQSRG